MGRVRLGNLTFNALLPAWMRGDVADMALAAGVDEAMWRASPELAILTVWDVIDQLPEAYLDELAWSLDIRWYDSGAPIETKRRLVLESDRVHQSLGTVAAVESVVTSYFGDSQVIEWFDYDGRPHHFKVFTTDASGVTANMGRFLDMLEKVKRLSSKLDGIVIGLVANCEAHIGTAVMMSRWQTFDWVETEFTGREDAHIWAALGMALHTDIDWGEKP